MSRRFGKWVVILLGALCIFIVTLFVAMSIFNSPTYAWRILWYGESDIGDAHVFPERIIEKGATSSIIERGDEASPYEVEYPYQDGTRREVLEDLLKRTGTRAFLILQNDRLIYESYFESARQEVNTSFSTAKSFSSALIGAAIADGYIDSVDDPVIQYVPEIAGRGLDPLTIRDLLLMNSGIRYLHSDEIPFYMAPFSDDALTYYPPDLREVALRVEASGAPIGAAFRYNNYHMLLEGLVIERVSGMHVAEYLQEKFWKPMGAEFPASWSLDSEKSGFEKMESGINARAVDYARFGLIFLHNGYWNGVQILPEAWVAESTQPLHPDPRTWETMTEVPDYGGYYKYHWWGINNPDGTYDFPSHGKYDQIIYIAPRKDVVIVRLGDRLDENVTWALVLHNLVDQLP
ncbi:MAG TPA: serine hydrolase [Anaerolineales bacterium]|nr:serine hydrolase [Anaerolineales bacterium]